MISDDVINGGGCVLLCCVLFCCSRLGMKVRMKFFK